MHLQGLLIPKEIQHSGLQTQRCVWALRTSVPQTLLSRLPLVSVGPCVRSQFCGFMINKICHNMKWEMDSDEKCVTAVNLFQVICSNFRPFNTHP